MSDQSSGDDREPLILPYEPIIGRAGDLFASMEQRPELQASFIDDPVGTIAGLRGQELPPQESAVANQVLFSAIVNPEILSWLGEYATAHRQAPPPRDVFIRDFGAALLERGANESTVANLRDVLLIEPPVDASGPARSVITENTFINDNQVINHSDYVSSGIAYTTDHQTINHQTQDNVQDAQVSHEHHSAQTFTSPAHSTGNEIIPDGQELVISPELVRVTIDALTRRAFEATQGGLT